MCSLDGILVKQDKRLMILDSESAIHSVSRLLLSHHPPQHSNRTVILHWGRHRFRVCSRCLGFVLGFLTAFLLGPAVNLPVWDWWFAIWLVLVSPMPAIVDFHGQLMVSWESTNLRRILTGMILGIGASLSILKVLNGNCMFAAFIPCVLGFYFAWVTLNRGRMTRMLRHLRLYSEYYERCCAEDARKAVHNMITK